MIKIIYAIIPLSLYLNVPDATNEDVSNILKNTCFSTETCLSISEADTITKKQLFDKIKKVTSTILEIDKEKIKLESSFNELGADDLDVVEIVMELEDFYKISIPDPDLEKFKSIKELFDYLVKKLKIK